MSHNVTIQVDENSHRKRRKTPEQILRKRVIDLKQQLLLYLFTTYGIFDYNLICRTSWLASNDFWIVACSVIGNLFFNMKHDYS